MSLCSLKERKDRVVQPYINENLPEKYHKKQILMYYQFDILADMLFKANEYNLAENRLRGEILKEVKADEDIIEFLMNKQKDSEVAKILKPHLFFSILADFTDFILESLRCIEKGKVIVSFSLSRKPLQDNLFYLCWLLTKPEDLISKLLKAEDSSIYDISKIRRNNKDEVKKVLKEACNILSTQHEINPGHYKPEILYDLIYEKSSPSGMSSIWDQSVHLVTSNRNYKTKPGNINFLFSNEENLSEFMETYFQKMPILLDFCLELCVNLYEDILNIPRSLRDINFLIRTIKRHEGFNMPILPLRDFFEEKLPDHVSFVCDNCSREFSMTDEIAYEYFRDPLVTCSHCGFFERTGKYLIGNEQLEELKSKLIIDLD